MDSAGERAGSAAAEFVLLVADSGDRPGAGRRRRGVVVSEASPGRPIYRQPLGGSRTSASRFAGNASGRQAGSDGAPAGRRHSSGCSARAAIRQSSGDAGSGPRHDSSAGSRAHAGAHSNTDATSHGEKMIRKLLAPAWSWGRSSPGAPADRRPLSKWWTLAFTSSAR